jgi:hypothetical protein
MWREQPARLVNEPAVKIIRRWNDITNRGSGVLSSIDELAQYMDQCNPYLHVSYTLLFPESLKAKSNLSQTPCGSASRAVHFVRKPGPRYTPPCCLVQPTLLSTVV